jgi:BESS motif
MHFKPLLFLAKHIQIRSGYYGQSANISNAENFCPPRQANRPASDIQMPHSATNQPAKRSAAELSDDDESDPKDDDYYFLMSLHPYMGYLDPEQKLRLRMAFHKVMYEELYKSGYSEEATQSTDQKSEISENDA